MRHLKKTIGAVFSLHLPRPKIGLHNVDIHHISYSERLIHWKRHLKKSLSIEFKKVVKANF